MNAICHDGGEAFSNSSYWSENWEDGTRINLNTYEETYSAEIPNTETESNNAILKARKYGRDLGVIGRLLTYDEANSMQTLYDEDFEKYGPIYGPILFGFFEEGDWINSWLGTGYEGNSNKVYTACGRSWRSIRI